MDFVGERWNIGIYSRILLSEPIEHVLSGELHALFYCLMAILILSAKVAYDRTSVVNIKFSYWIRSPLNVYLPGKTSDSTVRIFWNKSLDKAKFWSCLILLWTTYTSNVTYLQKCLFVLEFCLSEQGWRMSYGLKLFSFLKLYHFV